MSSTNNKINLEFGFNPIKETGSGVKHREKKKAVYFSKNDVYFDEYLDTLQAPGRVSASPVSVAPEQPGPGYNSIQNSARSPKHFPYPSPSSRSAPDAGKHDRKSNLDFLGIFDIFYNIMKTLISFLLLSSNNTFIIGIIIRKLKKCL